MINYEIVEGCPVADGGAACCRNCGGGWPGTKIKTEAMTRAVQNGRLNPERLGCGPLYERAVMAIEKLKQHPLI